MTTLTTNRRVFDLLVWCFAGLALVILLTSCSPYATGTATPSATATATASIFQAETLKPTPLPYWILAAQHIGRFIVPAVTGGKINYTGE